MEKPPRVENELPNIVLACSGSVASVKVPEIAYKLSLLPANVLIVASQAALHFIDRAKDYDPQSWKLFEEMGGKDIILSDDMEWSLWESIGDTVLHIELRRWASVVVLAPASANTIAKMNAGLCDSLLLSFFRAMDEGCPKLLCPAMNTNMYQHPLTGTHLTALQQRGWALVAPVAKELACGDSGTGALAAVATIIDAVHKQLQTHHHSGGHSDKHKHKQKNLHVAHFEEGERARRHVSTIKMKEIIAARRRGGAVNNNKNKSNEDILIDKNEKKSTRRWCPRCDGDNVTCASNNDHKNKNNDIESATECEDRRRDHAIASSSGGQTTQSGSEGGGGRGLAAVCSGVFLGFALCKILGQHFRSHRA